MVFLIIVSVIWSLSFGLIKNNLTNLDPNLVALIRLTLSLLIFSPFIKLKNIPSDVRIKLVFTGAIQYGVMYIAYIHSFQYLQSYQIALFTILTPIYISLINDLFNQKFSLSTLGIAFLAVFASLILVYKESEFTTLLPGFFLVQISNISFAFGQLFYKTIKKKNKNLKDRNIFPLLYLGAVLITLPFTVFKSGILNKSLNTNQFLVLLYLGIIASGVCFFLWNLGVVKTNIGNIAILNNLKIPLAILFSVLLFKEKVNLANLFISFSLLSLALFLNHKQKSD